MSVRFSDNLGREWTCKVVVSTLEQCKDAGGFDPIALIHGGELWRGVIDPMLIAELVWHSVASEANARNITRENFKDSLSGQAILDARDAWFAAFAAFLPPRMGEALMRDKVEVETRLANHLNVSPESGGQTSTPAQASPE